MGSHFSAPVKIRSERSQRGVIALLLVLAVLAAITVTGSGIAGASTSPLAGYIGPRIIGGGADVNGDAVIDDSDTVTDLFGDTDLLGGLLDCDNWGDINDDVEGDGSIDNADDCILKAFTSTSTALYIHVANGHFAFTSTGADETGTKTQISDGTRLPGRYKDALSFALPGDYRWYLKLGYMDTNGDDTVNSSDNRDNFPWDGAKITEGYANLDGDATKNETDDDSCSDGCFFGYNVEAGKVMNAGPSYVLQSGSQGPQGLPGTNGVSGRVSIISSSSTNSLNKSKSATCSGTTKVLGGGYNLVGTTATLAHLTVVANGPVSGGWRVRVIEATPTTGTWSVDVSAICATA